MSLDESVEETFCSPTISLALPPASNLCGHQGERCAMEEEEKKEEEAEEEEEEAEVLEEEEDVKICRVLWCYCLRVEEEVEQKEVCLVLCDRLVGLLFLPGDFAWTGEFTVTPAKLSCAGFFLFLSLFLLLSLYLHHVWRVVLQVNVFLLYFYVFTAVKWHCLWRQILLELCIFSSFYFAPIRRCKLLFFFFKLSCTKKVVPVCLVCGLELQLKKSGYDPIL